jgi:hypothetical protein
MLLQYTGLLSCYNPAIYPRVRIRRQSADPANLTLDHSFVTHTKQDIHCNIEWEVSMYFVNVGTGLLLTLHARAAYLLLDLLTEENMIQGKNR